ncbi:MAG TPA: phosphoribosylglycinamide formyltransferase [Polyangiaceae bacterium]|nr:phosphoribosylglycinamide formyltransferase [Polyangiaceae bacterium]
MTLELGVLVSGSGSNLQALLDASQNGALDARIRVVISNRPGVYALERAQRAGVPVVTIDHKAFPSREAFDAELVSQLRAHGVEWVALAGFMRVLTPVFIDAFADRIVNIHPALLPSFPGVDGPGQAFRAGVRVAGCTVHFVELGVDSGPILVQRAVAVLPGDDEDALRARILEQEHQAFVEALELLSRGTARLERDEQGRGRVRFEVPGARASST